MHDGVARISFTLGQVGALSATRLWDAFFAPLRNSKKKLFRQRKLVGSETRI